MTVQELIGKIECYRDWRNNGRKENPIELGLSDSGIDEMLSEAIMHLGNANENRGMTINEYQEKAMTTCMATCENHEYMLLNLIGEVGELCGKIAKHIRKGNVLFDGNGMFVDIDDQEEFLIEKELGDVMWQTAGVAKQFGWKLEDVARGNLEKLASRKQRNKIDGDGDER